MSLADLAQFKPKGTAPKQTGLSALASFGSPTKKGGKPDLSTPEGLAAYATQQGLGSQVAKIIDQTPKLSFLQRLGAGLGAFNPAEAILTGEEKGVLPGLIKYPVSIAQGIGSAFTGTDYQPNRRSFADAASKMGIEKGVAKYGIGFVGDVLLDPTTYFGGAIAKGVAFTVKGSTEVALKGVGKVAPMAEAGLRLTGEGIKDAAGTAFNLGYKASKGAKEDVLTFLSRKDKAQMAIAGSNLDRLGTGTLSKSQQEELALSLASKRRAEFALGESVAKKSLEDYNKLFPDRQVKDVVQAEKVLGGLDEAMVARISDIRKEVEKIIEPFFTARKVAIAAGKSLETPGVQTTPALGSFAKIDDLNRTVDGLREQAAKLRSERTVGDTPLLGEKTPPPSIGGEITHAELVATHNKLIGYEEERLWGVIDDLSKKIERLQKAPEGGGLKVKLPKEDGGRPLSPEEVVVYAERVIKNLVNETADREMLLRSALDSRSIGKKLTKGAVATKDFSAIEKIDPEIARTLRETSSDPVVRAAMKQQLSRTQKFAKNAEIDDPYTFYFPFLKKESVDKFVKSMESSGIRVGSEGYRKEFRNLLTNEQMELNPANAYFSVESRQVSDNMTRAFLSRFVGRYGKPLTDFEDADKALSAGYKVVKEKGRFGKEIGYVPVYDSMLISNLITPEFHTINMLAKATGFDAVTALFKRAVTGLFVPFHVRNFVSGMVQNFEIIGVSAFSGKAISAGQKLAWFQATGSKAPKGVMMVGGAEVSIQQVYKQFVDRFGSDSFYVNDFETAIDAGSQLRKAEKILSKSAARSTLGFQSGNLLPLVGQDAVPMRAARAIGQYIEHQQKATVYLLGISQGNTIEESLKLAERAGFDYRALTAFESQVMRRIIPFYSFTRKNIELQLSTLGENPQRINQILAFFANNPLQSVGLGSDTDATPEEKNALPAYIRNSLGIKLADLPSGIKQYVSSFGTPVEQFTSLVNGNPILLAISMSNPLLKAPIELGIGKDSFRQQDIKEVYDAKEYSAAPQVIKDLLDIKEVQKDILRKNAKGKLEKVGERTVYMADPTKLLIARSLFTSRGFSYFDQIFDGDINGLVKWVKLTTGIKPQQVDIEFQAAIKERDQRRAFEDLLIKAGEAAKFQNIHVPKE